MMEKGFQKNNGRYDSVLDGRLRDFNIRSSRPENAVLNHPAVQPLVEALKTQFASRNTDKNAAEITKMAEDYFLAMHGEIGKTIKTAEDKSSGGGKDKAPDFSAFLPDLQ
jgi:hypothetical protein